MATEMQLNVLFGKKSHGRPDFCPLTWTTEKALERVIENKRNEFCRKKNMKIQSGCETIGPFIREKISRGLHKTRKETFIRVRLILDANCLYKWFTA